MNWKGGISQDALKYRREIAKKCRLSILETLGGKCIKCHFNDYRALQIDHIEGGGSKERKTLASNSSTFYKKVLESFNLGQNKYQLLCANCNWIKRAENNERNK